MARFTALLAFLAAATLYLAAPAPATDAAAVQIIRARIDTVSLSPDLDRSYHRLALALRPRQTL